MPRLCLPVHQGDVPVELSPLLIPQVSPPLCSFSCVLQAQGVTPFTELLLLLLLHCNYLCCKLMLLQTVSSLKIGIFFIYISVSPHPEQCLIKETYNACYLNELFWDGGRGYPVLTLWAWDQPEFFHCVRFSIHTHKITGKKKKFQIPWHIGAWVVTNKKS